MKNIIEIIKKKWLRDTFLTALLICIIFAMYFLINYAVKKINVKDIDLTSNKIYSISEQTKTKLASLDKDVQIKLLNLSEALYIQDFANQYKQLNSHISVTRIDDLNSRPEIMEKYDLTSQDSLILISSTYGETQLYLSDLFTYDYETNKRIDKTEEKITNAIIQVTVDERPKVYFLIGHNAYDDSFFQIVKEDIKAEANEVENLNLLKTERIPEDCNCLVITALKTDLTEIEKERIIQYANNGGKILLLAEPEFEETEKPNYNAILDLYGFRIPKGILLEQDSNKMIYGYPQFIISDIQDVINQNVKMNMEICAMYTGKINFIDQEQLKNKGIEYRTIAKTSDSTFLRKNLNITSDSMTGDDEKSPESIIGALVTRKIDEEKTSEMIVYSNCVFATNQPIANIGYANRLMNNQDVLINSVAYLTNRTDTITVRKNIDSVTYTVTAAQHNIIVAVIFGVPIIIIIAGIIVWQIRRRKK